jgi:hypothetical protein
MLNPHSQIKGRGAGRTWWILFHHPVPRPFFYSQHNIFKIINIKKWENELGLLSYSGKKWGDESWHRMKKKNIPQHKLEK